MPIRPINLRKSGLSSPTHEVKNQVPPLVNYNLLSSDTVLSENLQRLDEGWEDCFSFGEKLGTEEVIDWGFKANEYLPKFLSHDRYGYRVDQVEFHPAWHHLMSLSVENEVHSLPWLEKYRQGHGVRIAKYLMVGQIEQGHCCPITMTFAAAPVLKEAESAQNWLPKILSSEYDPEFKPMTEKKGVILGMAMTEKQGGSDVRENTTLATPLSTAGSGQDYWLKGHKWFCSAPMSDAFLVLAQAPGGLSCFLVPRFKPDGETNVFLIQRLKNKLGNRSNASSEIEFDGTWGQMLGEEGRGVPTIIKMVNHTRLDCVLGSTSIMKQAMAQAIHHATYRKAFGKKLIDQPLMKNVLADLALETEAATALCFRLGEAYDASLKDSQSSEESFKRMATAVSKYWVCKRTPAMVYEAMESLGGAGYVEESIFPRLYREAPLNSIWEGSGNVNCLDVFRALIKKPESLEILLADIQKAKGSHAIFDSYISKLPDLFKATTDFEPVARRLVEKLVLALQASLLIRYSPSEVSDAFCESRLSGNWGYVFGDLPPQVDFEKILKRVSLKI